MNRPTLHDFYDDPDLYRRLAHRERARAIAQALAWLRQRLVSRFDFNPGHWMERLG